MCEYRAFTINHLPYVEVNDSRFESREQLVCGLVLDSWTNFIFKLMFKLHMFFNRMMCVILTRRSRILKYVILRIRIKYSWSTVQKLLCTVNEHSGQWIMKNSKEIIWEMCVPRVYNFLFFCNLTSHVINISRQEYI